MGKNNKSTSFKKILIVFVVLALVGVLGAALELYRRAWLPNTSESDKKVQYLYIKTTDSFEDVIRQIEQKQLVSNVNTFRWMAEFKQLPAQLKPGKYQLRKGMNNNQMVNILKAGLQEKVKVSLYTLRTKQQLASRVGRNIEADSTEILNWLNSDEFEDKFGINQEAALSLFFSGDYEMPWATTTEAFFERMKQEYKKVWNEKRKAALSEIGLTQTEAHVLASIVQQEQTLHPDERPLIAGVYLNRLKIGMKLQADPTVIFAWNDFTIDRVLNKHVKIDSPYNTYQVEGLPPGPIGIPTLNALDAVLFRKQHRYLYFCAKEDLKGYHNFAVDYNQHTANAKKYQKALDRLGIN